MKKTLRLCAAILVLAFMASCNGGGQAADKGDEGDIHVDGDQTAYVLIFRSAGCAEQMLREIGEDSALLDDFYTAEDDLGYYYHECYERLETLGVKHYKTTADKKVFCPDGTVFTPQDCCACGVLIVKPGCGFEFVGLIDFLCQTDNN